MSDHNSIQDREKWKTIPGSSALQQTFTDYQTRFGKEWSETKEDSSGFHVRLKTLEEYRPLFEEAGKFLIIQ